MDMTVFYLHIASELGTNVCLFSKDNIFIKKYSKRLDLDDPIIKRKDLLEYLLLCDATQAPIFSTINRTITYSLVEDDKYRYLIGPVLTDPSMGIRRDITIDDCPKEISLILNKAMIHTLVSHTLLLHNFMNPPGLDFLEFFDIRFSSEYLKDEMKKKSTLDIFRRQEYGELHNPYDNEIRLLSSIENGDVNALKLVWEEEFSGKLGITAKDIYRSGKNLAIGTIVIATRAAIKGGLNYETAFSMCDAYEMQIEELKDMFKLESLVKNAELTFTEMVHDIKEAKTSKQDVESSPIIRKSKDYIHTHMHEKLTVLDISDKLHVHPNYLSSLFHKCEGVSLYQYIINEKINMVKNLLAYSPYSYMEIANYLGFSSQSHLGNVFKNITGYTLKDYRDKYQ